MNLSVRIILFVLPLMPLAAMAEEGMFYGMLRSRDLTPFGFVRLDMRPAHAAIRALPGENYLMDMEQGLFDVTVHYKIAEDWTTYGTFGWVSFSGGFMDSTIEKFHDTFGFSSFGRPAVARNDMNLVYDLKGAQLVW